MSRNNDDWTPTCTPEAILARARMLAAIRGFFAERGVIEVETPLLCRTVGTDPNLDFFESRYRPPGDGATVPLFLQTSPEFAMKRLLAAGSGPIYQICKAFRNGEAGRYHNPEFTLLEWYRPGFSLEALMDETERLLRCLLEPGFHLEPTERVPYREVFLRHAELDPLSATAADFRTRAEAFGLTEAASLCGEDKGVWLDFMFSHVVQPHLGAGHLCMVYDFPACQAALARLNPQDPAVAERVEVFLNGLELANGYRELADAAEQARRFDSDLCQRQRLGKPRPVPDRRFLAALTAGLPECSGIAVGIDRMLMLSCSADRIDQVLTFPLMHT